MKAARRVLLGPVFLALVSCGGGGGGGGSSSSSISTAQTTALTMKALFAPAVVNRAYSWTMTAQGGTPPYKWSATGLPVGLSLDSVSGTISGTPTTAGSVAVNIQVTDSGAPQQNAGVPDLLFQVNPKLSFFTPFVTTATQYDNAFLSFTAIGGVSPYTYTVTAGTLPPGMRLTSTGSTATLTGGGLVAGQYTFSLTVADQLQPPDMLTQQFSVTVTPAPLTLSDSVPARLALNRPYSGSVVAKGGTTPYTFTVSSGSLPPGLTLDTTTGGLSGTPNAAGNYSATLIVHDSSSPAQSVQQQVNIVVGAPLGRNDSPPTATPINNGFITASISPYVDPPNGTPAPGDHDYYSLHVTAGSIVHVETLAKLGNSANPLDTVLEIVDGNGQRFSSCRLPGDATFNFTSSCLNDDQSSSLQDSALDYKTVGNSAGIIYVHVFDWRGDARPDMIYSLRVSGAVDQLAISPTIKAGAAVGAAYSSQLSSSGGSGGITWSLSSGSLPPGITLSPSGLLSGTCNTAGTYSFSVTGVDSGSPQQSAGNNFSIIIGLPPVITTTSFPDAFTGIPYNQPLTYAGGTLPFMWSFSSNSATCPCLTLGVGQDGAMKGTAVEPGTFAFMTGITDAIGLFDFKHFTITIRPGPLSVAANVARNARLGVSSFDVIPVAGGTPGFTCSVATGTLPPGMSFAALASNSCPFSGTPTAAGTYVSTFTAVDSAQPPQTATGKLTITVAP
jgi:Putative Ig domain